MEKLKSLLKSRKFWALIAAIAIIASGYFAGGVDAGSAVNQAIAAIAAYMIATGIEDAGAFTAK